MKFLIAILLLLALPVLAFSATYHVPTNFGTIQDAINGTVTGDTIVVGPGTYYENIQFIGNDVILMSEEGPHVTVLDGSMAGSVVIFQSGEGSGAVLDGFTITNGSGTSHTWPSGITSYMGGGVFCITASPTIQNNIITGNRVGGLDQNLGGGITGLDSGATVLNNLITSNISEDSGWSSWGGGVAFVREKATTNPTPEIVGNTITHNTSLALLNGMSLAGGVLLQEVDAYVANNIIAHNSVTDGSGTGYSWGGGLSLFASHSDLVNNTIVDNKADYGGGGYYAIWGDVSTVVNSILWDNSAPNGKEILLDTPASAVTTLTIDYTDVDGGTGSVTINSSICNWGANMINSDPLFAGPAVEDYHLTHLSPCSGTGSDSVSGLPSEDFEGDPRISSGTVDMGADEFHPHLYMTGDTTPGGAVEIKFIGMPGDPINGIIIGVNIFDPPLPCDYGLWYMDNPFQIMTGYGFIPADGIKVFHSTIPASTPSPLTVYLQAAIDSELTNLCRVDVLEDKTGYVCNVPGLLVTCTNCGASL